MDNHNYIVFIQRKKIGLDISYELSAKQTIHTKRQVLFLWKQQFQF